MRRFWIAVLGSGFIAGCGGGGGDDAAPSSIAITAANQDGVARASASAMAAISGAGGGIDVSTGASAATAARAFAARVAAGTASARKQGAAANRVRPLAVVSESGACTVSGSFTLSVNDADGDEAPTPGDTLTMSFANCRDSASESIDGSMAVSLAGFEVDGGYLSFSGATTMSRLKVTEGTRSTTLNGNVMLSFAQTSATDVRLGLVVGNAGLTASETIAGETETISFEPEFAYRETGTFDADTGALLWTSATINGGFSASAIGGRVQLETPTAIVQRAAEDYPYVGVLRAVGQGSSLRLTAVDATTVRVELDANQDGSYEASKNVAWDALLPR